MFVVVLLAVLSERGHVSRGERSVEPYRWSDCGGVHGHAGHSQKVTILIIRVLAFPVACLFGGFFCSSFVWYKWYSFLTLIV